MKGGAVRYNEERESILSRFILTLAVEVSMPVRPAIRPSSIGPGVRSLGCIARYARARAHGLDFSRAHVSVL